MLRHAIIPPWMAFSVSLDMFCFSFKNRLYQSVHVVWIHLTVSSYHHADERGIEHVKEVLMASVDGCTDSISSAFKKKPGFKYWSLVRFWRARSAYAAAVLPSGQVVAAGGGE